MHVSSFKNRHFVWSRAKESLKLNKTINVSSIRLNIISYYSLSLNTCECLICQIYQQNCNRLKNHTHIHQKILPNTKSIRYTSETKRSWKGNIFIISFRVKDFFSIYKRITIIRIIM